MLILLSSNKNGQSSVEDKINYDLINSIIKDTDCGHRRIETIKCELSTNISWLSELKFQGMKAIFKINIHMK